MRLLSVVNLPQTIWRGQEGRDLCSGCGSIRSPLSFFLRFGFPVLVSAGSRGEGGCSRDKKHSYAGGSKPNHTGRLLDGN